MGKRKVCVVTGTRAEYGILYWLLKEISSDPSLELQLAVTGAHLSPEFGLTYKVIEQDGFKIDAKIEMLLSSDSSIGTAKSMGLAVIGFAEAYERLKPDIAVVLGDRYEILAAAQAALVSKIPIAHLLGGDTTEGAFDEAIRHSITKMAHLHFVANELAAKRLRQMGENQAHIYNVGSPGIDYILRMKFLSRSELEKDLQFKFLKKNLLVTYHPVTLEQKAGELEMDELLAALGALEDDVGIIFTRPNADPANHLLHSKVEKFASGRPNAKVFISLGQTRYLSLARECDAVVGNSSSGLYEVPSLGRPTVNIGDRQKGRLLASSVVSCAPERKAITAAIQKSFSMDCTKTVNPYGNGVASEKIKNIIRDFPDLNAVVKKRFHDLDP